MDGEQLSQNKHKEVLKSLQLQWLCFFSDHNVLLREKEGEEGEISSLVLGKLRYTSSSSSFGARNEEVEIQLP